MRQLLLLLHGNVIVLGVVKWGRVIMQHSVLRVILLVGQMTNQQNSFMMVL